jgi:hypothetical protein
VQRANGVVEVVEHLPSKSEALRSTSSTVNRKTILKITSVLAPSKRRVQARHKDLVKVTVKFIRRETMQRAKTQLLVLYWTAGGNTHRC